GLVRGWSGYERADDLGSIFGHNAELLRLNTPLDSLPAAAPALRRTHTFFWLYTGADDRFRTQNVAFAQLLKRERIPHHFFLVQGGHNWALWRGKAGGSYYSASM